jgi:hypothetical protein
MKAGGICERARGLGQGVGACGQHVIVRRRGGTISSCDLRKRRVVSWGLCGVNSQAEAARVGWARMLGDGVRGRPTDIVCACLLCSMFGANLAQNTTMLWGHKKKSVKSNPWVSSLSIKWT